jgi:hypothetical protein
VFEFVHEGLEDTRQDDPALPLGQVAARCAVTSISIFILGSMRPHAIIVAAGRTSPNQRRRTGQQRSKSLRSGSR